MKHLMTLMALVVAVTAGAQTGLVEFPYNPDSNGDDMIGTADLLDLLSLFGNEFSKEDLYLNDDSTTAIYYAGNMPYFLCLENCSTLPGKWKLPNVFEIGRVWSGVTSPSWLESPLEALTYSGYTGGFHPYYIDTDGDIDDMQASLQRGCYCYTHERPKVEYSYCEGGAPSALTSCIQEKLADGWLPLSGWPYSHDVQAHDGNNGNSPTISTNYSEKTHASFWRWAE
jgi:hypothetical protein